MRTAETTPAGTSRSNAPWLSRDTNVAAYRIYKWRAILYRGTAYQIMKQKDMVLLREECSDGNDRACHTLQRLCENGRGDACQYVLE